jgi:thymidylate synthase
MSQITPKTIIPTLTIVATTLPEAFEKAVRSVWENGIQIKTEYDQDSPPSLDCTGIIIINSIMTEPMIHKNIKDSYSGLEIYAKQLMEGIHDWMVDAGIYSYMYSHRLTKEFEFDQIEAMIQHLVKVPYTRRAQATTSNPYKDHKSESPPCLQRIWMRLLQTEKGSYVLNVNLHWRSRDLYKAWFQNMYGIARLIQKITKELSKRLGVPVFIGRVVDINDSLHIYGSDLTEVGIELEKMKKQPLAARTISSKDPTYKEAIQDVKELLVEKEALRQTYEDEYEWVKVAEATKRLDVSQVLIYQNIKKGKIQSRKNDDGVLLVRVEKEDV